MPTQHVPPDDSSLEPWDAALNEQIHTVFDAVRLQTITDTLRQFQQAQVTVRRVPDESITGLWLDDEPVTEAVTPAPIQEPTPAPEVADERWPRETVWIMQTPTRRGPGRVSAITRSTRWNDAYNNVLAYNSLPSGASRHHNGFTRPDRLSGINRTYRWWYLGWHTNGHPMFAVQMVYRIDDEGEIRRAIRELISSTVTRVTCNYCYNSYPVSDEWPIRAGHAAHVYLTGYGQVAACAGCSASWDTCAQPGCRERGRRGDMIAVRTDPLGTDLVLFCESHARSVTRCIHCNIRFASASVHHEHNCLDSEQDWERCTVCNNQTRAWSLVTFSNGARHPVCSDGMRRCMRGVLRCTLCQGYTRTATPLPTASSVAPGGVACTECAEANGITDCEHCGYYFPAVDAHDCHSGGRCRCELCRGHVIRSYSYKPKARFQGKDRYGLFLGMELEIFVNRGRDVHDVARAVQADLGRVGYIKSDGSISHGFEIVTHPMSYEYAMSDFPWQVLKTLDDHGSFATDGSGIHIHASRKGFSGPSHEYRWMIFLHRNQRQAQVIARRISNQWASFSSDQRKIAKDIATKKTRDSNRYRAINQTNSETIEIRIFESSTDEQTVRATIGFVHASIEYARVIRSRDVLHDDAWSWKAFAKWIKARPEYAALYAEMERLNVTEDDTVTVLPTRSDPRNNDIPSCQCDPDPTGCGCRCDGENLCRGQCVCRECDGTCYDSDNEDW